jgi:cyclase
MADDNIWHVTTHGGTRFSDKELYTWAQRVEALGAGEILFTSMNHDGTRHGYPNDTYAHLASLLHIPIIASGGAGCAHDIAEVLTVGRADAALAASIFHYGELTINQLKKQLQAENIPVRL